MLKIFRFPPPVWLSDIFVLGKVARDSYCRECNDVIVFINMALKTKDHGWIQNSKKEFYFEISLPPPFAIKPIICLTHSWKRKTNSTHTKRDLSKESSNEKACFSSDAHLAATGGIRRKEMVRLQLVLNPKCTEHLILNYLLYYVPRWVRINFIYNKKLIMSILYSFRGNLEWNWMLKLLILLHQSGRCNLKYLILAGSDHRTFKNK